MFKVILTSILVSSISYATEIKVFFADEFKNENSYLQTFDDWYSGTGNNKFTLKELYKQGWKINNVVKTNGSAKDWQMSFFMEISDKGYKKVAKKFVDKKEKTNKEVNPEDGL